MPCQNAQRCVTNDDAVEIAEKVKNSEYVGICDSNLLLRDERPDEDSFGQDSIRCGPSDYKFRNVYMLSVAAEDEEFVLKRQIKDARYERKNDFDSILYDNHVLYERLFRKYNKLR